MHRKPQILSIFMLVWALGVVWGRDPLTVQTTKGAVKGVTQESVTGKEVDAWYGIPFAQPPIGDLRFRHPRPIDRWHGIKDATKLPLSCYQIVDNFFGEFEGATMWNANTEMSEDCLTISVIVPKPRPRKAAVLVWIYGGGFYSGTSTLDIYDYKTFASEQNIIIVAPQYRVASLGFLYMGHSDVPGNTGLFDQLMALQWIHDNIEFFGGNKENITLFGESAGASSVSMHLLSPLSRNLFSQAIMQSGSATDPSSFISKEESISRGLRMAKNIGCPNSRDDLESVIDCLKKANVSTLVWNEPGFRLGPCDFPFVPIVDGSFFLESPQKSLKAGNFKKTNIIMGSNTEEGYWFIMYFLADLFRIEENLKISHRDFKASIKELFPSFNDFIHQSIEYQYTNWLNIDDENMNRDAIDKMIGDYHFTCNVNEFAHHYALFGNNVYMYYFTHRSTQHHWPKWTGVLHGDEISYIFGQPLNPKYGYSNEEVLLSRQMMAFWANFAKTGNPSEASESSWSPAYWPVHTVTGREYLTLAANTTSMGRGPRLKECAFWKQYLPQLLKYTSEHPDKGPEQCPNSTSHDIYLTSSRAPTANNVTPLVINIWLNKYIGNVTAAIVDNARDDRLKT